MPNSPRLGIVSDHESYTAESLAEVWDISVDSVERWIEKVGLKFESVCRGCRVISGAAINIKIQKANLG